MHGHPSPVQFAALSSLREGGSLNSPNFIFSFYYENTHGDNHIILVHHNNCVQLTNLLFCWRLVGGASTLLSTLGTFNKAGPIMPERGHCRLSDPFKKDVLVGWYS